MLPIDILFVLVLAVLVRGKSINDDLARGLQSNDAAVIKLVSNSDSKLLSKQPEDCAAAYLHAKATRQPVRTGIYEIWPRQGNWRPLWRFESFFVE